MTIKNTILPLILSSFLILGCNGDVGIKDPGYDNVGISYYLNDPGNSRNPLKEKLMDIISNAKERIWIAGYKIDDPELINALIEAKNKGIKVIFIGDGSFEDSPSINTLKNNGIEIHLGNSGSGYMMYNAILIDQDKSWIQTSDFTEESLEKDRNIAIYIVSKDFAEDLEKELMQGIYGVFGRYKTNRNFTYKFSIGGKLVRMYFTPKEKTYERLENYLKEATKEIYILTESFEDNKYEDLQNAIISQKNKGLTIKAVIDFATSRESSANLYNNGIPIKTDGVPNNGNLGVKMVIIDPNNENNAKVIISTSPWRYQMETTDDGILLIIEGEDFASEMYNKLFTIEYQRGEDFDPNGFICDGTTKNKDIYICQSETTTSPGSVIISEFLWGSTKDNTGGYDAYDQFIEIYNREDFPINISDWEIKRYDGTSWTIIAKIPKGMVIPPKSYITIGEKTSSAFPYLDLTDENWDNLYDFQINSTDVQLAIFDRAGNQIDSAGDGSTTFESYPFASSLNNTANKTKRSVERITSSALGNSLNNWKMNTFTEDTNSPSISSDFNKATFASPGEPNSPMGYICDGSTSNNGIVCGPQDIVISEVLWAGAYFNDGTSDPDSEFIELYNRSDNDIYIGMWHITHAGGGTDPADRMYFPNLRIPAKSYFVIAKKKDGAIEVVDYVDGNMTLSNTGEAGNLELKDINGNIVDSALANGGSYSGWGGGLNQLYGFAIRRSMERKMEDPIGNGTSASDWYTSHLCSATNGNYISSDYSQRTYATPGEANSTYINPRVPSGCVVINEIGADIPDGSSTSCDYIELYNPNDFPISLKGFSVQRDSGLSGSGCDLTNGITTRVSLGDITIGPHKFLLITDDGWDPAVCGGYDGDIKVNITINDDDCVNLSWSYTEATSSTGPYIVDFVGYGDSTYYEGSGAAPDVADGTCIERNTNHDDTNDNSTDFTQKPGANCSPQSSSY